MTITFFEPMIPPTVTHQEKKFTARHGKLVAYEPPELKDARAKLMAFLSKHSPPQPMTGPVILKVSWLFPITGKHTEMEPKQTKPDTDNLQKLLKDVMTDLGYWKDDAQVFDEHVKKFYSDLPGIAVFATNDWKE